MIIVLTFFKVCHHGRWSCNRRTFQELLSCGMRRKMVCWGGVRPRPGPRLPPLEGGGRQPCTGLLVVLPPVRKSPVSRAAPHVLGERPPAGRVAGTGVGWGVRRWMVPMDPHVLLMSVACATARATAPLDVVGCVVVVVRRLPL